MSWSARLVLSLGELALDVSLVGGQRPLAIIGPNGSGKTTLLRAFAGAYRPSAGRIVVGERTLFDADAGVDLPPEARRVGYVPQGFGLFPHLSILDNVAFGAPRDVQGGAPQESARRLLEAMNALELIGRPVRALSGGEQQRIALARALVTSPEILLLDEPLSSMDARARRELRTALAQHLEERGLPALFSTHDVRDVRALGASVVAIEAGRVVQAGSAEELEGAPATAFIAEFFGK